MFVSAVATASSFAGNVFAADEFDAGATVEKDSFVLIAACDSKLSKLRGRTCRHLIEEEHSSRGQ